MNITESSRILIKYQQRTVEITAPADNLKAKYDALFRLRKITLHSQRGTHPVIQYEYDQLGRRISRSMTGPNAEPTRKWVYRDGLRIAAELNASDNITSRFVYSTGRIPVQMIRGNTAYLLVTDYLGSLRAVVRLSDGEIMQRMEYDEFGRVIADDVVNGFERVPFGYAGGLYDRGTGLVRFGARDYDAEAGRWVSKDPVGLRAGSNVYAYCGDDPINRVDPFGLDDDAAFYGNFTFAVPGFWSNPSSVAVWPIGGLRLADVFVPAAYALNHIGFGRSEPDTYTIYAHGIKESGKIYLNLQRDMPEGANSRDMKQVADWIRSLPGYEKGMSVQLFACWAGEPGGPAEQLSKGLDAHVSGPTDKINGYGIVDDNPNYSSSWYTYSGGNLVGQ